MNTREEALLEIYERIKEKRVSLGLTSFKRTPSKPIDDSQMPCVFMLEGIDRVIDYSSRNSVGYPLKRSLEVTLELVVKSSVDIKDKLRELRRVIFTERGTIPGVLNPKLVPEGKVGFIQENRTEGPTGYGIDDILGMDLVLDLIYIDDVI
jgi:hypothetical protein